MTEPTNDFSQWESPEPICLGQKEGSRGGTILIHKCNQCGKIYERYPNTPRQYFCGRSCYMTYKNLRVNPMYKHGKHWSRKRRLAKEALEERGVPLDICERCGGTEENPKLIHFHHKDRDEWNNTPENVEVLCMSCHMKEHYSEREINDLGQFVC